MTLVKILYLDDNMDDGAIAVRKFQDSNILITCCNTPSEALVELKNNIYTLLISDILMPQQDGLEFAHTLEREGIDIPVIFCSGVPNLAKFSEYSGVKNYKGFILKPITPEKVQMFL